MPELPEVQTVVTTLIPRLVGRRITRVEHVRPDIVSPPATDLRGRLTGRTVTDVSRRAKRVVITLDDDNRFYIHLGMTGRLTIEPRHTQRLRHTHLILAIARDELRFRDPRRFGGVFWLGNAPFDENLGREPLDMNPRELARRLSRTKRCIKSALLDQALIAGLGNIYVDESLFQAGLHPLTPSHQLTLDEVRHLNRSIKQVLRKAIRHRGSTLRDYVDATGGKGAFQNLHNVYDRADQPCRACGSPIVRLVVGGRSTHFCPRCQPAR